MADYVTGIEARDRAIAAGGCWCWLFSARVLHWLLGVVPVAALGQSLRAGGQAELMIDQAHE